MERKEGCSYHELMADLGVWREPSIVLNNADQLPTGDHAEDDRRDRATCLIFVVDRENRLQRALVWSNAKSRLDGIIVWERVASAYQYVGAGRLRYLREGRGRSEQRCHERKTQKPHVLVTPCLGLTSIPIVRWSDP